MSAQPMALVYPLTPRSAGAIAVTRVVGPGAEQVVTSVLSAVSDGEPVHLRDGKLTYAHLRDGEELVDDVIACRAKAGCGKGVEICSHGSPYVVRRLHELIARAGAEVDTHSTSISLWPSNNKIEAEAIDALQLAKTPRAVRFLARQRAILAPALERCAAMWSQNPIDARAALEDIQERTEGGVAMVNGVTIAIVGPPNAGKSTLFNRLLGRDGALVSETPGTTRDWVSQPIDLDGVPLELIDTAGRRDTPNDLERQAIAKGRAVEREASRSILLLDATCPVSHQQRICEAFAAEPPDLVAVNKIDLRNITDATRALVLATLGLEVIPLSAGKGEGMEDLANAILRSIGVLHEIDHLPACFSPRQARVLSDIVVDLSGQPDRASGRIRRDLLGM